MNTPAVLTAYMFMTLYTAARAKWNVDEPINCAGAAAKDAISAPARAAAANSIARNNRPLPRKTVAKNRSSWSPRRSRNTPMNQRKAIPANGTKFRASAILPDAVLSHDPAPEGRPARASQQPENNNQQNRKQHAGDCGGPRSLEARPRKGPLLGHGSCRCGCSWAPHYSHGQLQR